MYFEQSFADAPGDSAIVHFQDYLKSQTILAQAKVTTVGTVKVQGRLSSSFDWIDLHSFTTSGSQQVYRYPEMRLSVTALGDGHSITAAMFG